MGLMAPLMVAGSVGIGLVGDRGDDTEEGVAEPENNSGWLENNS